MALDTRNCFWFGTEERASWFATPLQGADSSPSAWGADGTLLNGGGWGLHSWGSHKRYTYEWPASSSREVAQKMKSYRDGTYGRGLLYFLEPTIFTTNVLPAHWADPSMSLDNEAPSLVYGVDPTPVATSGGANQGLPVTSAQYDLSGVTPQSIPTPDSSVFIPIPTGHTLFLGAFYSSTGTGGVFATPVNGNGTLGTAVKLTEKSNSDTDVVTDRFSGDLRGIRLWVGRSDATPSTVTIAAMAGRLIETSEIPVYGPWVEDRRSLFTNPAVTSLARLNSTPSQSVLTYTGSAARWTLQTTSAVGIAIEQPSIVPGDSYRLLVRARSNTPFEAALRIAAAENGTVTLTTSFEWYEITVPAGSGSLGQTGVLLRPGYGHAIGDWVEIDRILFAPGPDSGEWYDGSSNPSGELERTRWLGTPNDSASVLESRTRTGNPAKESRLKRGPWIGGQGHSGCRFLGTPTYVTNSPIEGGRIGFAATFVEVGSWVYG